MAVTGQEADAGQVLEGRHRVVGDELVVARLRRGSGCSMYRKRKPASLNRPGHLPGLASSS